MKIKGTNLSMVRGDTEYLMVEVKDPEGNFYALTNGDIIYFTVKDNVGTEKKALQKVVEEFEEGKAFIVIDPEDTKSLRFKKYVYDIQLTRIDGTITTIIPPSIFEIQGEVTYE